MNIIIIPPFVNGVYFWPIIRAFEWFLRERNECVWNYPPELTLWESSNSEVPQFNFHVIKPGELKEISNPGQAWIFMSDHLLDMKMGLHIKGNLKSQGLPHRAIKGFIFGEKGVNKSHLKNFKMIWGPQLEFQEFNTIRTDLKNYIDVNRSFHNHLIPLFRLWEKEILEWQRRYSQLPDSKDSASKYWGEEIKSRVLQAFWRDLESRNSRLIDPSQMEKQVESQFNLVLAQTPSKEIPKSEIKRLLQSIKHAALGLGPLEFLLSDSEIKEVMVTGQRPIFVERNGQLEKTKHFFRNRTELKLVIDRMVGQTGRRIDFQSPLGDFSLKDGSRVNIALPPVSLDGPNITIRRFPKKKWTMARLVSAQTLRGDQADLLEKAVQDRKNILISGNTGSGKTTLVNVLSSFFAPAERIITLEDAAELQIAHAHVVRLETRLGNAEGVGSISMLKLVQNALRMRPDRIIVGECRGPEVIPMIQALNTGHAGSMTTLHANSAQDAVHRLESLILMGAPHWNSAIARRLIGSGFDLVVHLHRDGSSRRVSTIEALQLEKGEYVFEPLD